MDVRTIRQLAEVMDQYQLEELSLEQNDAKVHLVKRNGAFAKAPVAEQSLPPMEMMAPVQETAASPVQNYQITSPLVGTFYRSASEDGTFLVNEGDRVKEGTVVCIIEAMKVMNEIKSERAGVISRVRVENGKPVEFGQPLFDLEEM